MTTRFGNDMVNDFRERGTGALALAQGNAGQATPVVAAAPQVRPPARTPSTAPAGTSDKQRKRTREQRLVLALARLLASRMR